MSKINDLIKELCPNGVKFDKLENVTLLRAGDRITTAMMSNSFEYDVVGGGILPTGKYNNYNREHCITISRAGSAGFVNWKEGKFWATDVCFTAVKNNDYMNIKFIYHYLKNAQKDLQQHLYGGSMPKLEKNYLWSYLIPIPPTEIQEEIVRILDKFGELEAELEARKSQYEFWHDKIFKFENRKDVKWLKLKDIKTEIYRGNGIKRDQVTDNGIPCVRYGEIYTTYNIWFNDCKSHTFKDVVNNPKTFTNNDLLFAITGESVEEISKTIVYTGNNICYAGGDIVVMKHNQNGKYLSYALSTKDAIFQKGKGKVKSKVVHSSVPSIEEIVVPIVSLEEQKDIVKKLDHFYNIINDITVGLPAEVELRRKQYEYYRNKLLSFEKLEIN